MMPHIAFGYVDDDGIDYDLYKHNQFLQQEARIDKKRTLLSYEITQPFPVEPGTPNYTLELERYKEKIKLVFWRQLQADGTYIPFIRVTPLTSNNIAFICGASFKVIAGINLGKYGIHTTQLALSDNVSLLAEGNNSSFCENISKPTTLIWDQWDHKIKYDANQAFVIIYDYNDQHIRIPAIDGTTTVLENSLAPTISQNLNIHIPTASYQGLIKGTLNLWVNLQPIPRDDGSLLWQLKDYGINK
jgi:hypothetical protein